MRRGGGRIAPLTRHPTTGLIIWQVVVGLVIGWALFGLLFLVLVALGWSLGKAAIWSMLLVGGITLVIGVLSTDIPASDGPRWLTGWFAARRKLGASLGSAGGLTFTAQCLVSAVPMLAIALVFGT